MEGIRFEDDEFIVPGDFYQRKISAMVKLVIKVGLAEDEKQANFVLLLSAIVFIIIAILIGYFFLAEKQADIIPFDQLSEIDKLRLPEAIRNSFKQ